MLLVDSLVKRQGPFSWKRPIKLLQPGPPLSQRAKGAVVGLLRASKNHQKRDLEMKCVSGISETDQRTTYIIVAEVGIPGVLSDTRSLFADPTVGNITQGYTCVGIPEYGIFSAIFPVAFSDGEEYDDEQQRSD